MKSFYPIVIVAILETTGSFDVIFVMLCLTLICLNMMLFLLYCSVCVQHTITSANGLYIPYKCLTNHLLKMKDNSSNCFVSAFMKAR